MSTVTEQIRARLFAEKEEAYRDFQSRLMPTVEKETVIGVRTPLLRQLAKELAKQPDIATFLNDLPHRYYEENNLHGFIISLCKDYAQTVAYVDAFLPYVDNWATCDQMRPAIFAKNRGLLRKEIPRWLHSEQTYTVRFGIEMLMNFFLDEAFTPDILNWVAEVHSTEYYVRMMQAWFFATALCKQWASTLPIFTDGKLEPWVHNKSIQKALESRGITQEQKGVLRTLKREL